MKIRALFAKSRIHTTVSKRVDRRAFLFALLCALSLPGLSCQSRLIGLSQSVPSGSVLFQDDFSDPQSGWKGTFDSPDGFVGYYEGTFRFLISNPGRMIWSGTEMEFSNARIEADALKKSGPSDDDFGLVCRAKDQANFYFFVISSDGYYGIGKTIDGVQSLFGARGMLPSELIQQGIAVNHLRADCVESELVFYVNGSLLASVHDDSLADGAVGLVAGTFDEPGNEIIFDNFSVLNP